MIDISIYGPGEYDYDNKSYQNTKITYYFVPGKTIAKWFVNNRWCEDNKTVQKVANLTDEDMLAMILKYGNVK